MHVETSAVCMGSIGTKATIKQRRRIGEAGAHGVEIDIVEAQCLHSSAGGDGEEETYRGIKDVRRS